MSQQAASYECDWWVEGWVGWASCRVGGWVVGPVGGWVCGRLGGWVCRRVGDTLSVGLRNKNLW